MMKGPFYQLDSREGLKNDDFAFCADYDLIEAANTQAMRVLVIGKPRSGKSTIARNISKKLDLIHINVDNWIAAVYEKIKTYEPPELEEG
jgi:predicted GTPase